METDLDKSGSSPGELLPVNPSFAGHQTFALRTGWLKKGMLALQEAGPTVFTRDEALVILGVGKNMVQSIRHWLVATRVAEERPGTRGREIEPSPLGLALFGTPDGGGWDPYLEDDATLWLLHWQLAGPGSPAFTWLWAYHVFREYEFSRDALADSVLSGARERVAKLPARETILRDVECLLHTYAASEKSAANEDDLDCPLHGIGLIRPSYGRYYRFDVGPKDTLPPAIFYYALVDFWRWRHADTITLPLRDITYEEGSPGMAFKLDEDSVLEYLDPLAAESKWGLRFEDTAILRHVVREPWALDRPMAILEGHYNA